MRRGSSDNSSDVSSDVSSDNSSEAISSEAISSDNSSDVSSKAISSETTSSEAILSLDHGVGLEGEHVKEGKIIRGENEPSVTPGPEKLTSMEAKYPPKHEKLSTNNKR